MRRIAIVAVTLACVLPPSVAAAATASAAPVRPWVKTYLLAKNAPGLALSIANNSSEDGAPAVLAPATDLRKQQWAFSENDSTSLRNVGTRKCLQFHDTGSALGSPVVQDRCTYGDPQTWYYPAVNEDADVMMLENVATGTCITAQSLTPGATLIEAPCDENNSRQQWTFADV